MPFGLKNYTQIQNYSRNGYGHLFFCLSPERCGNSDGTVGHGNVTVTDSQKRLRNESFNVNNLEIFIIRSF